MTVLKDNQGNISAGFPDEHFKIEHNLLNNPLFDLDSLIELARTLPETQIEWNAGDADVSQDPDKTPANGLSPEDTIAQIEQCKSWLVMKNIESHPDYREVLHACLAEVESMTEGRVTGIDGRAGFVFVSSPGSITPFHMDPEHNFLLQLRGTKNLHVFDQRDRRVVSEENIENTYYGSHAHRNLIYKDDYEQHGKKVVLTPGEALHIPIHAPHWVHNGDEVSISFSITFRSDQSRRAVRIHTLNARMRKLGLKPANVGRSGVSDASKDFIVRTAVGLKQTIRR